MINKIDWQTDLLFHVYVKNADRFQKTHDTYDHWACFIVEEGQFQYQMNGIDEEATKNQIVLCSPGIIFYRQTSNLSFHYMGFNWKENVIKTFNQITPNGKINIINTNRVQSTLSLFNQTEFTNRELELSYKNHLFQDLWKLYIIESSKQLHSTLSTKDPFINNILQLLHAHIHNGPILSLIAEKAGISRVQLTRIFKNEFHITPSEYIQKLRLNRVRYLLLNTSLTLAEIAEQCGFTDEHHLSKRFKSHFGTSPSIYRKQYVI